VVKKGGKCDLGGGVVIDLQKGGGGKDSRKKGGSFTFGLTARHNISGKGKCGGGGGGGLFRQGGRVQEKGGGSYIATKRSGQPWLKEGGRKTQLTKGWHKTQALQKRKKVNNIGFPRL